MSLAYQVDSLDGVEESQKAFYQEKDGKFILAIDGLPEVKPNNEDTAALVAKKDQLLDELKVFKQKAKKEAQDAEAERIKAAKASGDVEAVGKSWEEKYEAKVAELTEIISSKDSAITQITSGNVAARLAGDLALDLGDGNTTASTLEKLILTRLRTETKDGKPTTVVLDEKGQPTALTIDEFKKEFASTPSVMPLIAGSKASGGGANGSNSNSGGAANEKTMKRSQFDSLDPSKKMEFSKAGGSITDD